MGNEGEKMELKQFLPVCKNDLDQLGWDRLDFIIVSGDAYVDHPSFGVSIIGRVLTDAGYKVGIIPQPDWKNVEAFKVLGRPRLGFLVAAGNIDSMVNHYTVSKRRREMDNYSPGGVMGLRPDRATIVYTNKIKEAYKKVPIILGGVEASLRRFAHYDYWDDAVRRSILVDTEADLLIYGMGEHQVLEIANYMNEGIDIAHIHHVPGTCYLTESLDTTYDYLRIPSYEQVIADKTTYAKAFRVQHDEQDPIRGKTLVQAHGNRFLVQNPPTMPLNREELDQVHNLFFMRDYHPMYKEKGGIPAIQEVKHSIISERGCFGGCSFCALTFHQGRIVQSRSHESIISEAKQIISDPEFKGYIHDVGGPTANFRNAACAKQLKLGACKDRQCLFPTPCKHLIIDHQDLLQLLRKLRGLEGVKKVFIRSGIRYDYLMADPKDDFFNELCVHHVSGQLKVAPEHIDEEVLHMMGKPAGKVYQQFTERYRKVNEKHGKNQFIVPYLMSSHPGSTLKSAIRLAEFLRDIGYQPEQVQDFYPTPGTLSTCMYYTGLDPRTFKPVYIPKTKEEKALQRALLQFRNPKNYDKVHDALVQANRLDLIGTGPKCLIKPKGDGQPSFKRVEQKKFKKSQSGKPLYSRPKQLEEPKKGAPKPRHGRKPVSKKI